MIDPSSGIVSYLELLTGRVETPVQYENESMGKFDVKEGPSNQWGIRRGLSIPRYIIPAAPERGKRKGRFFTCVGVRTRGTYSSFCFVF